MELMLNQFIGSFTHALHILHTLQIQIPHKRRRYLELHLLFYAELEDPFYQN